MKIIKGFICALLAMLLSTAFFACDKGGGSSQTTEKTVNTVIAVSFAGGEADGVAEGTAALVEGFNKSSVGMNAFFLAESLGKCDVQSYYAGSVTVSSPVEYYKIKTLLNRNGYEDKTVDGKRHIDGFYREQALLREVLSLTVFEGNYNPDGNGDGVVDAVTFVFNEEFDGKRKDGEILWPHKSELYSYGKAVENSFYIPEGYFEGLGVDAVDSLEIPKINGASVLNYAVVSSGSTMGEICHEFSHILGKPDYYSYVDRGLFAEYDNIGKYDLMGASVGEIPQFSLSYVRYKLGWLEDGSDIKVLTESQTVTLEPVTAGGVQAVKLIPHGFYDSGEFIMAEVRKKEDGKFDGEVNATGLIVYTVKPENAYRTASGGFGNADLGNMYGDGDFEIKLLLNDYKLNYYNSTYNSTGKISLSGGTDAGIAISGIKENEDGSFTFDVVFEGGASVVEAQPKITTLAGGGVVCIKWGTAKGRVKIVAFKATAESAAAYAVKALPNAKEIFAGKYGGYEVLYTVGLDGASGQYIPRVDEEIYLAAVCMDDDGQVAFEEYFHVTVGEDRAVQYGFGDLLRVLFKVGNPAFIASLILVGLCVLVGFAVVVRMLKHRKSVDNLSK